MNVIYTTSATAKGGKHANVKSEDGIINLELRAPKEMGGEGGAYTNPEQLFAVGYSACFDSAINYVAMQRRLRIISVVTAKVNTLVNDKGGFIFAVDMDVDISGLEQKEAEELIEAADHVCPYSNSIRGNVKVTFSIKGHKN